MDWFYRLPTYVFAALLTCFFITFACAAVLFCRRFVAFRLYKSGSADDRSSVANILRDGIGLLIVLLGFLTVTAANYYGDVERAVGREAINLGALYHDVSEYPEPIRTQLQEMLKNYNRYLIDEAWPLQKKVLSLLRARVNLPISKMSSLVSSPRMKRRRRYTARPWRPIPHTSKSSRNDSWLSDLNCQSSYGG